MIRSQKLVFVAVALSGMTVLLPSWSGTSSAQQAPGDPAIRRDKGNFFQAVTAPPGTVYVAPAWSSQQYQVSHEQDAKTRELVSQYNATDDEKTRAKVLEDLSKAVSEQFDSRQEARETELKQLEEQLRKLRELHARRAKEKDQIVRDRVRQLLRDADGLGWGTDGNVVQPGPNAIRTIRETVPAKQ